MGGGASTHRTQRMGELSIGPDGMLTVRGAMRGIEGIPPFGASNKNVNLASFNVTRVSEGKQRRKARGNSMSVPPTGYFHSGDENRELVFEPPA